MSNELVRELVVDMAREIKRLNDRIAELRDMNAANAENIRKLAELVADITAPGASEKAADAANWASQELYEIWRTHQGLGR